MHFYNSLQFSRETGLSHVTAKAMLSKIKHTNQVMRSSRRKSIKYFGFDMDEYNENIVPMLDGLKAVEKEKEKIKDAIKNSLGIVLYSNHLGRSER